ncbi:SRPBCC domain-containing protein [Canibacter sp. lx-45]|uniref:SRPBCC family protein n=1 Tax=Canibacter zhuwentaonis TaxID=2837491 RepID=UPI001BDD36C2|nr:SRPBCC domain-containing protein [Canibacter zhuwentaonis]MBT1035713.1 SRPBCC domain-containing protein [Canibacter zhuwentaonis]
MVTHGPVIVRQNIEQPRDSVWQALTSEAILSELSDSTSLRFDPQRGGEVWFFDISGELDVWVPGHVFGYRVRRDGEPSTATLVTLRSRGDEVLVTVTETGFDGVIDGADRAAASQKFWSNVLTRLSGYDFSELQQCETSAAATASERGSNYDGMDSPGCAGVGSQADFRASDSLVREPGRQEQSSGELEEQEAALTRDSECGAAAEPIPGVTGAESCAAAVAVCDGGASAADAVGAGEQVRVVDAPDAAQHPAAELQSDEPVTQVTQDFGEANVPLVVTAQEFVDSEQGASVQAGQAQSASTAEPVADPAAETRTERAAETLTAPEAGSAAETLAAPTAIEPAADTSAAKDFEQLFEEILDDRATASQPVQKELPKRKWWKL